MGQRGHHITSSLGCGESVETTYKRAEDNASMKLRKVISGGQTGADQAGLACAKALGLETGGTAPKGYKTDNGPDLSLKDFGLAEPRSSDYKVRTWANVKDADVTLWFGTITSPGFYCTRNAATAFRRPFIVNPSPSDMLYSAERYEVWNIAGNRRSKNPDVIALVMAAFAVLSKE